MNALRENRAALSITCNDWHSPIPCLPSIYMRVDVGDVLRLQVCRLGRNVKSFLDIDHGHRCTIREALAHKSGL